MSAHHLVALCLGQSSWKCVSAHHLVALCLGQSSWKCVSAHHLVALCIRSIKLPDEELSTRFLSPHTAPFGTMQYTLPIQCFGLLERPTSQPQYCFDDHNDCNCRYSRQSRTAWRIYHHNPSIVIHVIIVGYIRVSSMNIYKTSLLFIC